MFIFSPTYNVSITQVNVGGNAADLDFNAIFDSGTSFTYLNDPAYTLISENVSSLSLVFHAVFRSLSSSHVKKFSLCLLTVQQFGRREAAYI